MVRETGFENLGREKSVSPLDKRAGDAKNLLAAGSSPQSLHGRDRRKAKRTARA